MTELENRCAVEASRMRTEGFRIPRGYWREVEITEGMSRYELRKALARGMIYVSPSGAEIDGLVAVEVIEGSYHKMQRRKNNG